MSISQRSLTFPAGNKQLTGYYARPEGNGPFPGIVVIHEIFGLNDNIKDITGRLAKEGYAALAVDLFTGQNRLLCIFRFFVDSFRNSLNHEGIQDLKATLTFLSEQPEVDSTQLGAIGFCLGGGFAIAWACTDDRLNVIAPFYGSNPHSLDQVARSCPVVGSYPQLDITAGAGRELDAALTQHAIPHDIKIYKGTLHSFFNDRAPSYNAAAAEDSWQRVLSFFTTYLSKPSEERSGS